MTVTTPQTRSSPIDRVPPAFLAVTSIVSTQIGAGIAKHLFASIGPGGTVLLRIGYAAVLLLILRRPRLTGHTRAAYLTAILFGVNLAAMNFCFYEALNRIPLGIAVTLEFIGPLGVAVAGSRRALDLLWVGLAATGIVLLAPWGGLRFDLLGMGLALVTAALWAAYILLSPRVGRAFPGSSGLVIALVVGTILLLPIGLNGTTAALGRPDVLLGGLAVGVLSSVITFSFEMAALQRMEARVFGVLMSIEPAIGALVGLVVLGQTLGPRAIAAIACVVVASIGAARFENSSSPPPID